RGGNLVDLKAQQIELLSICSLVHDEVCLRFFQACAEAQSLRESLALRLAFGESIEQIELAGRLQEGLVLVRAVNVYQPLADSSERRKCRRRTVDELAVRTAGCERTFQDQRSFMTRLQPGFFEEFIQRSSELASFKHGLDGAAFGAAADQCAIRALTEHQVQSADEHRFAGAGFASDDVVAGAELEGEISHERQVLDAQD